MLVSRFLLDLQSANQRALKVDSDDPLYLDSMSFSSRVNMSRIVGSLATPLGQRSEEVEESTNEDTFAQSSLPPVKNDQK